MTGQGTQEGSALDAGAALRRARVGGMDLAWLESGARDDARPLVLVHGYTGSHLDFAPRLADLAGAGRVLVPDLRGHGRSGRAGSAAGYTFEAVARDLLAWLDALGIEQCDLLGHSMGGMVALRAALAAPGRFASLLLMDTAARCPDDVPVDVFRAAWEVALREGMERLFELFRSVHTNDPQRARPDRELEARWGPGYWEWRRTNYLAMDPVAYAAFGRAIVDQVPVTERLSALPMPSVVLVGALDRGFLDPARELARALPDARTVTIPDAGHQPQLETPEAWARAVLEHLARVREQPPSPRTRTARR